MAIFGSWNWKLALVYGRNPGVDVSVRHCQPQDLVSWTRAVDPYTFYACQIPIASKREAFENRPVSTGCRCRVQVASPLTLTPDSAVSIGYKNIPVNFGGAPKVPQTSLFVKHNVGR